MRKLNTSTARVLLALWLLPAATAAEDLPMPTVWDTVYAWFLVANPEHVRGDDAHEAAVTHDHIQYQLRLQVDGLAVAGGGLGAGGHPEIIGLTLLRAGSLESARALAAADPAVKDGRFTSLVREWWIPGGRLP